MKILVLTRYSDHGASSRVRVLQYIPYLKRAGFSVDIQALLSNKYLESFYRDKTRPLYILFLAYMKRIITLIKMKRYDLLWIEKELFPMFPCLFERLIFILRVPFIVDYDDAIFHNYDLSRNKIVRALFRKKIDTVMKMASVVIVGNDYLAERALKAGARNIEYIPSVVDLRKYEYSGKFNKDVFKIGWIGSPPTANYLNLIYEPLKELCSENDSILKIMGVDRIELPGVRIEKIKWEKRTEVDFLQEIDVGIMPLPDLPWERGKCGYKLIQYMACGRPVIASPVGVNLSIVRDGYNGILASSENDWAQGLRQLKESIEMRRKMGLAGRKLVEEKYCLQVAAPKLVEILNSFL